MATREFVVQKVGDRYVTVPVDHYPYATRTTYGVWGVVLAMMGLNRRGWPAAGLVAAGGLMAYRAATGTSLLPALFGCCGPRPDPKAQKPNLAPSYQHDFRRKAGQRPADEVDEASMASFPASDPPAKMSTAQPK